MEIKLSFVNSWPCFLLQTAPFQRTFLTPIPCFHCQSKILLPSTYNLFLSLPLPVFSSLHPLIFHSHPPFPSLLHPALPPPFPFTPCPTRSRTPFPYTPPTPTLSTIPLIFPLLPPFPIPLLPLPSPFPIPLLFPLPPFPYTPYSSNSNPIP